MARPATHPLGPLVTLERVERPLRGRLYAAGLAAAAIALLATAARLVPESRLVGTHRQLGLPPCGFMTMTGLPCPTCGMTTAFAYTVRGRFLHALQSQAAGFLLALMTAVIALVSLTTVLTGRWPAVNWYRLQATTLIWWVAVGFVLAWGLKIGLGLVDGTLPAR